jgi:hypothetical protein
VRRTLEEERADDRFRRSLRGGSMRLERMEWEYRARRGGTRSSGMREEQGRWVEDPTRREKDGKRAPLAAPAQEETALQCRRSVLPGAVASVPPRTRHQTPPPPLSPPTPIPSLNPVSLLRSAKKRTLLPPPLRPPLEQSRRLSRPAGSQEAFPRDSTLRTGNNNENGRRAPAERDPVSAASPAAMTDEERAALPPPPVPPFLPAINSPTQPRRPTLPLRSPPPVSVALQTPLSFHLARCDRVRSGKGRGKIRRVVR